MGNYFPKKGYKKKKSIDGKTLNQLMEHVLVNGNMRTSVLDTRVMRGVDVFSDHYLVRSKIRLKLMKNKVKSNTIERFDVKKFNSDEIRRCFNAEVRNRFQELQDVQDVGEEYDSSRYCRMYRMLKRNMTISWKCTEKLQRTPWGIQIKEAEHSWR